MSTASKLFLIFWILGIASCQAPIWMAGDTGGAIENFGGWMIVTAILITASDSSSNNSTDDDEDDN